MNREECDYCVKRRTIYCPNSNECYSLDNLPYFQTKLDVLKENQELKKQIEEYQKALDETMSEKIDLEKKINY